jgi:hypothetical protein
MPAWLQPRFETALISPSDIIDFGDATVVQRRRRKFSAPTRAAISSF